MNRTQREQAIARLERRAQHYQSRLEHGHYNKGVITRWQRELLKTRAMIACLRDGRRRGPWDAYLEEVRNVAGTDGDVSP